MAARGSLRTVKPGDESTPADKAKPKSVTEAAKSGTTRELLVAARQRAAEAIDDPKTPATALAALMNRLLELQHEIEAIDAREEGEQPSADPGDGDFDAAAI